jgi:5-methylcytosine-specific restriction endonuclease McrA
LAAVKEPPKGIDGVKITLIPVVYESNEPTIHVLTGQPGRQRSASVRLDLSSDDLERQMREPVNLTAPSEDWWIYRNYVVVLREWADTREETLLRIKHRILRKERAFERLKREVAAFERFEAILKTPREPIPDEVRMFVWQRDGGRCTKCGGQERLEFDHVIPLALGGANTGRNIQLLCETCNRQKGAEVV